jgi:hypothetical protein
MAHAHRAGRVRPCRRNPPTPPSLDRPQRPARSSWSAARRPHRCRRRESLSRSVSTAGPETGSANFARSAMSRSRARVGIGDRPIRAHDTPAEDPPTRGKDSAMNLYPSMWYMRSSRPCHTTSRKLASALSKFQRRPGPRSLAGLCASVTATVLLLAASAHADSISLSVAPEPVQELTSQITYQAAVEARAFAAVDVNYPGVPCAPNKRDSRPRAPRARGRA